MSEYIWNLIDDDCSSLGDWLDLDSGGGESSQATYDGRSCFKLDSGASEGGVAELVKSLSFAGKKATIDVTMNHAALGTRGNQDHVMLYIGGTKTYGYPNVLIYFASDGLFVHDDGSIVEIGTNIVQADAWQEWRFIIDWSSQTLDVYLDNELVTSGVSCILTSDGSGVGMRQYGDTTTNRITYIDGISVTDGEFLPVEYSYRLGASPGTAIQLYPEWDYSKGKKQIKTETRLKGGGLLDYKWGDYDRISFSAELVPSSEASIVNSWWDSRTKLQFFISSGSSIDVTSVMLMNKDTPLGQLNKPYTDLCKGSIILEGY